MVVSINVIHRQVQAYHDVCMNELGKVVNEETDQLKGEQNSGEYLSKEALKL